MSTEVLLLARNDFRPILPRELRFSEGPLSQHPVAGCKPGKHSYYLSACSVLDGQLLSTTSQPPPLGHWFSSRALGLLLGHRLLKKKQSWYLVQVNPRSNGLSCHLMERQPLA
jgi:hypothetical protein